jgi:RRXRR protein
MSNFVFVIDTNKTPLDPVPPGQARRLLSQGKAAVYRRYPFTIIVTGNRERGTGNTGWHMVWALDPQMVRATDLYVPYK